jgi:hypothetical protein
MIIESNLSRASGNSRCCSGRRAPRILACGERRRMLFRAGGEADPEIQGGKGADGSTFLCAGKTWFQHGRPLAVELNQDMAAAFRRLAVGQWMVDWKKIIFE